MMYNGAEIVIKLLEKKGVKYIAGIPGGFNLPLYDALYKSKISHILTRHEQGAGFIAQGISRTTDNMGVCISTSGPGVTNLLTPIADAKLDSIPLIAITGQVPLSSIGTDAFQEVDTYGLTIPITKHNFLVRNINDLFKIIPEAFHIATTGRPGPVLIDIPKNIQTEKIELSSFPEIPCSDIDTINLKTSTLEYIGEVINKSKKPIIYAGGGITNSHASKELFDFAKLSNIPVALSLMGLDSFPSKDELCLGMLGMHGAPYTNYLLNEADLLIALGIRFDDRATGDIAKFAPHASIIHVDIDPSEINKIKASNISLISDVKIFLSSIIKYIDTSSRVNWINRINYYKKRYPLPSYDDIMHPSNIISYIGELADNNTIIATDVGQHQMWTAQRYSFIKPKTFLTSGGLGTMGFGLPVSIGAALANPNKPVICFSGDGSFQMNIQELATLADLNLNVKIIILNNHHLGLVRQQQELFYQKHYIASKFLTNPDFKLIAEGYSIPSCDLSKEENPLAKLKEIISLKGPYIINIPISETENVYPMVPPGAGNTEMIGDDRL